MPGPRTEQKLWYLKQIRVFEGMPEAFIGEIERITRMEEVSDRALIYNPGEAKGHVYILKKGSVRIYGLSEGRRVILDELEPGDIFGDLGQDAGESGVGHFAEATMGSLICIAPKADFLRLLQRYPAVALRIIQNLGTRLASAEQKIRDLALHDVSARIVHELARRAQRAGDAGAGAYVVRQRFTHEELADSIGATRETVTRALAHLREHGTITVSDDGVTVHLPAQEAAGRLR